jgi:hypothetical protein
MNGLIIFRIVFYDYMSALLDEAEKIFNDKITTQGRIGDITNMNDQQKKNNANYWNMDSKGKFKRTMIMLPICIVLTVILIVVSNMTGDSMGIYIGVLIMIVWAAQAYLTYKRQSDDAEQNKLKQDN